VLAPPLLFTITPTCSYHSEYNNSVETYAHSSEAQTDSKSLATEAPFNIMLNFG
jgi:hypothetical protein